MSYQSAVLGNSPIFEHQVRFSRPALPLFSEVAPEIREVLESGVLTKGRHLALLEETLAAHLGVKHAIAVSSCTAGLMLTYQALQVREAVLPGFTFMATASSLLWADARPVFADVNRRTMNLDPFLAEASITPVTDAIIATHNFGNPAEIADLESLAARRGLRLIFDAAHGMGSQFHGQPLGGQGDAQVFSLSASKLLIAGEGGVVATDDDEVAGKIRTGREYGNHGNYDSLFAGINARLPEISALIARYSLGQLAEAAERRNEMAEIYRESLGNLAGLGFQEVHPQDRSSHTYFPITVNSEEFGLTRDELAIALTAENIETRRYYDPPVHRQTAYRRFALETHLPNVDLLSSHVLCLPIWSNMDDAVVSGICQAIERSHSCRHQIKAKLDASFAPALVE